MKFDKYLMKLVRTLMNYNVFKLPIQADEVLSYSPAPADKVALNTAIHSLIEIAEELKKLF
jgi:hypothetical protein